MDSALEKVRLTQYSHGGGCGCKLGPAELERILAGIPRYPDGRLLVGLETGDDAAVQQITDDVALVHTLDFFMPIVDDAFDFGRIAAANALSDVWAMGGEPIHALGILGFPRDVLPLEVAERIVLGAAETCREAGIQIVGGHSIDDKEPKFGLAVAGTVHPARIWRNSTGRVGDLLVLTKAIGTGTLTTAMKKGELDPELAAGVVRSMTFLNRVPARAGRSAGVTAATDVTGFSLLGHTHEMCRGAGLGAELWWESVPLLPGARDCVERGIAPGATRRNLAHYEPSIRWDPDIGDHARMLLADPQTSGGLLFAVDPERAEALVGALTLEGALAAAVVGRLVHGRTLHVRPRPEG
jgi:selenide,water dikinase